MTTKTEGRTPTGKARKKPTKPAATTPRYRSVADLLGAATDDDGRAFAEDFKKRVADRRLVKMLAVVRARSGRSQQELAAELGCTQSKVSKLENGTDADVRFGDLVEYLRATNHELRLSVVPKGATLADEVKRHAVAIKKLLDRMVSLAGSDNKIADGVASFLEEAAFNLVALTCSAADALPDGAKQACGLVSFEAPEQGGADEPTPPVRPRSRGTRSAAASI